MDYLKKWMIIQITPHQTTTLPKWMCFFLTQTSFLQIILAAKWSVRHSNTSLNKQRRPLLWISKISGTGADSKGLRNTARVHSNY